MTKVEEAWTAAILDIGCICCYLQGFPGTPAEIHHMLRGGRRIGHLFTLPLCAPGHHRYGDGGLKISRHPFKARFEKAYGTEQSLLERTRALVAARARGRQLEAHHP